MNKRLYACDDDMLISIDNTSSSVAATNCRL